MVKLFIKHFDHDAVADGGTFEDEWTADFDYVIKAIFFKRKDGAAFTKSDVTVWIAGIPLSKEAVLCNTFGTDWLNRLPIEEELKVKQPIKYSGVNREGATIDIAIEIVMEKVE